jgi:hypothetical protein
VRSAREPEPRVEEGGSHAHCFAPRHPNSHCTRGLGATTPQARDDIRVTPVVSAEWMWPISSWLGCRGLGTKPCCARRQGKHWQQTLPCWGSKVGSPG